MQRAAQLVKKNKLLGDVFSDDDLARAIWPAAVGRAIAAHTGRLKLVRNKLVVEVEDTVWQKQLFPLSAQILIQIRKVTGSEVVRDIEFRVAVPRQAMQSASRRESFDEAEGIQDPVLKKVYQLARKKASA